MLRKKDLTDGLALVGLLLALFLFAWLCAPAQSSQTTYQALNGHVATFAYQGQTYQPNAYVFQVGDALAVQAQQEYAMRNSPEWEDFQQYRAWKAGFDAARAAAKEPEAPAQAPAKPQKLPAQAGPPAEPQSWAAYMPTVISRCAKCHTGEKAKAGIRLDGSVDLQADSEAPTRDRIMRALMRKDDPMPKGGQLSPEEYGSIIAELYAD